MTELIEGATYTVKELQSFLGVSQNTWYKKHTSLLDNLSLYYEYEVNYTNGHNANYHIIKKLGDYQKPLSKRSKEKRDAVYDNQIIEVIKEDNLQTAANVQRIIKDEPEIQQFNHKDGTVYAYTLNRMKIMFGRKPGEGGTRGMIMDKIWCRLDKEHNIYIELPEEQIQRFRELFSQEKEGTAEAQLDLCSAFSQKLISAEELSSSIGQLTFASYQTAQKLFKAEFGFTPIKVPVYGIEDIDYTKFEDKEKLENDTE